MNAQDSTDLSDVPGCDYRNDVPAFITLQMRSIAMNQRMTEAKYKNIMALFVKTDRELIAAKMANDRLIVERNAYKLYAVILATLHVVAFFNHYWSV